VTAGLHVLCLHEVTRERPSSPWTVTEDEIGEIVGEYRARGYALVTLDDLPAVPDRALAVTVDDGRSGAVAWLLRNPAGVRATVFAVPGWVDEPQRVPERERYSGFGSWEELAELRDAGHVIGSHTMTHRALPDLPAAEARRELRDSRLRISEVLGILPRHLAPPFGRVDGAVNALAWEAGYVTVCTTARGVNGTREREAGVLRRIGLRRDRPGLGRLWVRP
jgi:peptidoglycan/xylan/chitin deacetylase (PgdA/CDA1 family)